MSSPNGHDSSAMAARRSVSRTVDGAAAPTRTAIDLWPSPCSKRYLNISRTRRISSLSAGIPFLPRHVEGRNFTPAEHPRQMLSDGGGIISESGGDYFSELGGRDHFGIRGRIASEFALTPPVAKAKAHDDDIVSLGNGFKKTIPDTALPPADEAVVAGGRRTTALRVFRPGRARPKPPEDAIDHPPIIDAGRGEHHAVCWATAAKGLTIRGQ